MTNYYLPFEPGAYYHVYNRGNNGDNLFYRSENYHYFLRKLTEFVGGYLDVYAYALLPNHFHFLLKTKSKVEVPNGGQEISLQPKPPADYAVTLREAFRRFFLCYSNSTKKQEGRSGSLFEKNFKRIQIENDQHLFWLFNYIHRNPQTHGLTDDFRQWAFSSYRALLSQAPTKLCRTDVLSLFGGREEFIRYHLTNPAGEAKGLWLE